MWKWLGKLTDQQRDLIQERLKYTDKELAKQGLKPGFRAAQMEPEAMEWEPSVGGGGGSKPASPRPASPAGGKGPTAARPGSPMSKLRPASPGLAAGGSSAAASAAVRRSLNGGTSGLPLSAAVSVAAGAGGSILNNIPRGGPNQSPAAAGAGLGMARQPAVAPPLQQLPAHQAAFNPLMALSGNGRPSIGGMSPMQQLRRDSAANAREDLEGCMKQLESEFACEPWVRCLSPLLDVLQGLV